MTRGTVLVAGASGTLGRLVVGELCARNYGVRAMSRRAKLDGVAAPVVVADALRPQLLEEAIKA